MLVGHESGLGSGALGPAPYGLDGSYRDAALVTLEIGLSVPFDLHLQPFGEGIDRRHAHSMKTTGYFVAPAPELGSRMQDRVHDLQSRFSTLWMDVHRDTPAVVHHGDGEIRVNDNLNLVTGPGEGFVYGVVCDFEDKMMQATDVRAAHIHARASADGLEPLQYLDVRCPIGERILCHLLPVDLLKCLPLL
jgi:hypothetical protein